MQKTFIIIASLLYFFTIRWIGLDHLSFFDYDAVKNYLIAQEISTGNFSLLFHHGAPLMHLFHALEYIIVKDYILFIPAIFESIGIILIIFTLHSTLKASNTFFLIFSLLIAGSSFLMVNVGRYFSLEPYSLFFFALWFVAYVKRDKESSTHLWILGLLILINYKMCILLPFCILHDFITDKKTFSFKTTYTYLIPAWIIPFTMTLAYFASLPVFSYLKTIIAMFFLRSETSLNTNTLFTFSVSFYTQYLIQFEHPLVFIGLLSALFRLFLWINEKKVDTKYLIHYSLPVFVFFIMALLPPAPRGIMVIIPFSAVFSSLLLYEFTIRFSEYKYLIYISLILSLSYPIYILVENTYTKSSSGYSEVTDYINLNKVDTLYTTSSIGIQPYLSKTIVTPIVLEKDYASIPDSSFVLVDAEALANGWKSLPEGNCLISKSNPTASQVMLALENAEYAGLNFSEALKANKKISYLKNLQLCIIKKGD